MKKNRIYLIIIILLLILAGYFIITQTTGTIRKELRDFAVEDTARVTKIFIADKMNQHVLLEREGDHWIVNKKYRTRKDAIDVLLKTLCRVDIKAPVPKAAFANEVKNLAAQSVKVEVYQGGSKPVKVIYVGGTTQDQTGTYMMLENSSTPFVTHIPGFTGYLTPRFFTNEIEWRERVISRYKFNDIASVSFTNGIDPKSSFKILNDGQNHFKLMTLPGNKEIDRFDTLAVKDYIAACRHLAFEYVTDFSKNKIDSVFQFEPVYNLTIEDIHKKQTTIRAYYKPNTGIVDTHGNDYPYDVDRMYARINDNHEIVVIQYFSFNDVFRFITDFVR